MAISLGILTQHFQVQTHVGNREHAYSYVKKAEDHPTCPTDNYWADADEFTLWFHLRVVLTMIHEAPR